MTDMDVIAAELGACADEEAWTLAALAAMTGDGPDTAPEALEGAPGALGDLRRRAEALRESVRATSERAGATIGRLGELDRALEAARSALEHVEDVMELGASVSGALGAIAVRTRRRGWYHAWW